MTSHWWPAISAIFFMYFIIVTLAVWRLTHMLTDEDGPYDMFMRLRHWIGIRYKPDSERYGKNVIAEAFTCFWCLSVWIAAPAALLLTQIWPDWAIYWLALSGGAILVNEVVYGKS